MWDNLIAVLNEMLDLYRRILTLSKEKRDILVSAKVRELETVTKELEMLVIQVGKLENKRSSIALEIAGQCGMTVQEATLSALSTKADKETAGRIRQMEQEFNEILAELAPLNEVNTKLIQQALQYIDFNINVLTNSTASPTYAPPKPAQGQASGSASQSLIDRKV